MDCGLDKLIGLNKAGWDRRQERCWDLTDNSQADGVTEDRAGVDLTLVLPGVREGHISDDQLPLPATQVLPHCQPRVLGGET